MQERYVIHVTKKCNMSCIYCYEKDKTSKYTKDEVVNTAITIASKCKSDKFSIEFLGGEPMLAFDIVKAVYEALEKEYANRITDYVITTNGTILNNEILSYLKNNPKIYFAVSIDGTRWANQLRVLKNGKNSFDIVQHNIKTFIKHNGGNQIGAHIVTHPYNIGNLFNSVKYLYDIGIRNIGIGTVESTIRIDNNYCNRFVKEMLEISKAYKNNEFNGLVIDLLHNPKPENDQRYYIKDHKTGKVIGESYGRAHNDITISNIYNSIAVTSDLENVIISLRKCVYLNHISILEKEDKNDIYNT